MFPERIVSGIDFANLDRDAEFDLLRHDLQQAARYDAQHFNVLMDNLKKQIEILRNK